MGESVEKPLAYYENNLLSLIHLLEAMKKYGVTKHGLLLLLHGLRRTGHTCRSPNRLPLKRPIRPMEIPNRSVRRSCGITSEASPGTGVISLRYFNPIGAHPSARIGELPIGIPNNLVPFITQTAIGIREQLSVFGSDYNTPDGSAIRDYINVVDLARAHVIAIRRLLDQKQKAPFEVFNLGTGRGLSVFEVIKAFEESTGQNSITGGRSPGGRCGTGLCRYLLCQSGTGVES